MWKFRSLAAVGYQCRNQHPANQSSSFSFQQLLDWPLALVQPKSSSNPPSASSTPGHHHKPAASVPAFDGQPVPEVPLSPFCSPGLASLHHHFPHVASEGALTILGLVPHKGSTPKTQPFLHSQFCRKIPAAVRWRICFALLCQFVSERLEPEVTYPQCKWPWRLQWGCIQHGPYLL